MVITLSHDYNEGNTVVFNVFNELKKSYVCLSYWMMSGE